MQMIGWIPKNRVLIKQSQGCKEGSDGLQPLKREATFTSAHIFVEDFYGEGLLCHSA